MARYNGGWIKLYRELLETDISRNPNRLSIFIHLMGMANLEDTWVEWGSKPRLCPRGSLVTSIRELSKRTGADRGSIERQLRYLALRDTIVLETETRGTFITIKNFSAYQDNKLSIVTHSRQDCDTPPDTPPDTVEVPNEELKNIRSKEVVEPRKNTTPHPALQLEARMKSQEWLKLLKELDLGFLEKKLYQIQERFGSIEYFKDWITSVCSSENYQKIKATDSKAACDRYLSAAISKEVGTA